MKDNTKKVRYLRYPWYERGTSKAPTKLTHETRAKQFAMLKRKVAERRFSMVSRAKPQKFGGVSEGVA